MNVSELIEKLEKVEDKSKEVRYWVDLGWIKIGMDKLRVEGIIDNPDNVLLTSNLPAEKFERRKKTC